VVGLRVASFNVRNGRAFDGWRSWPFRRRATAAAIASLDADVVGLQEAYRCQLRWLLRRLDGYAAAGEGRDGGGRGEHTPVLWRRNRLDLVEHRTRWYGDEPDRPGIRLPGARFPRVATACRLRWRATGTELLVVSTHLDAAVPANRIAAAEHLAAWVAGSGPVVVLADLNAGPTSDVLAPLRAVGLRDALAGVEGGTEHGFTGATDRRRIDHVLVSAEIEVAASSIAHPRPGGRLPSDHWPVVADLVLPDRRSGDL
jgi:endonuclease/exonuclease/phosphatase family metal-dependent hydrolase